MYQARASIVHTDDIEHVHATNDDGDYHVAENTGNEHGKHSDHGKDRSVLRIVLIVQLHESQPVRVEVCYSEGQQGEMTDLDPVRP